MAKPNQKDKKRKEKIKARQQQRERKRIADRHKEKADFFLHEAFWFYDKNETDKALANLDKVLRYEPANTVCLTLLVDIGYRNDRPDLAVRGMLGLHGENSLPDEGYIDLCRLLVRQEQYGRALPLIDELLVRLPAMGIRGKRKLRADHERLRSFCVRQLEIDKIKLQAEAANKILSASRPAKKSEAPAAPARQPLPATPVLPSGEAGTKTDRPTPLPEIGVSFSLRTAGLSALLGGDHRHSAREYDLALAGHRIRFQQSFDTLLCLPQLRMVRSFWYQEEAAKKVLKTLRGRALLADEVGLGKTIEALIVFKEYIQRGMVKNALILTPAPLVSQWRDELLAKFDLAVPCTDDADFKRDSEKFWSHPFILASINVAKSKNHSPRVLAREYDMVIVDEAHHLKNRTTINWKLVNSLKKRFLLLLTATPVENDLMELYNIVTLLKPGQLKTAAAFRAEFMTSGDPTDPRNREKLKELLGQVMIRNTRAVAKLGLPPRFAETLRVEPGGTEKMLYERIDSLVRRVSAETASTHRLLLKNLLAAAGSSPRALAAALTKILARDSLPGHEEEIGAILNLCRCMDDSAKNRTLLQLLKAERSKIIVFVRFSATLEYIHEFLQWQDLPHALFHGGLSGPEKDEQIRLFAEEKDILVTTEVGGEGRNLQFCHRMVNYDLPWNPMQIEQRIGRLHRIGQENEVRIYNLCGAGSMEDYILYVLDRKINMFELVIGEIDMILGRIRGQLDFGDLAFDIWRQAATAENRSKGFDQLAARLKRLKESYRKTKSLDEKLFGENYES